MSASRIAGGILLVCTLLPAQPPVAAVEKNKLNALLPSLPGFSGYAVAPTRFFTTDLSRYLEKGADAYLSYGLVAMAERTYRVSTTEVTAEIYDMGDPLHAFGIYSAERAPDNSFISMGAEGYVDLNLLRFLQGNYYVRLHAAGDIDRTPQVLEAAARNISSHIGTGSTVPQTVAWFPKPGMVPYSEKYLVQAPLGHDCLAPATSATYRFDDKDTTVLASRAATAEDAAHRLDMLKTHYAGKTVPVDGLPEALRSGDTVFFSRANYVVLVQPAPADQPAFLKQLYDSVK